MIEETGETDQGQSWRSFSADYSGTLTPRQWTLLRLFIVAAALVLCWFVRWAIDDAFISFRFSNNAARGMGFVFNPGEHTEGYTNFLWTAILVLPAKLGWSLVTSSQVLGLVSMGATLFFTDRLAAQAFKGNELLRTLALGLTATNATLLAISVSGMETPMQAALVTALPVILGVFGGGLPSATQRRLLASVVAGVALLVRLDSAVIITVWFVYVLWRQRAERDTRAMLVSAAQLGLPAAVILTPWFIWKLDFYGGILPNTMTAKSGDRVSMVIFGLAFVLLFFVSYGIPLASRRAARLLSGRWKDPAVSPWLATGVVIAMWCLYIVYVGGDWMEFRMLVSVTPLIMICLARALDQYKTVVRQSILVVVLLALSGGHALAPTGAFTLQSLGLLQPENGVRFPLRIAKELERAFPGTLEDASRPTISIIAIGVVPFETDLRTIDFLGLTDEGIARNGLRPRNYFPGHQRIATIEQLRDRGVNLMVTLTPKVEPSEPDHTSYRVSEAAVFFPITDLQNLPPEAEMLEIPIGDGEVVRAIYLTPHPDIDAQLASGRWKSFPIADECRESDFPALLKYISDATCPYAPAH